jgi:hypothetical protein
MHRLTGSIAALLAIAATAQCVHAADLSREQAQIQRAVDDAKRKQQSGQRYSLQSVDPAVDRSLHSFSSAANNLMSCSRAKSGFMSQFGAQMSQVTSILGNVNQLLNNSALKALAAGAVSSVLPSANSVVSQLSSTCSSFSAGSSSAANRKYDQVSQVMRSVFSGGDLSPNSRAVHHAADVDMPARGGTPEALRKYLNSQNGQVKKWYRDNFGLR